MFRWIEDGVWLVSRRASWRGVSFCFGLDAENSLSKWLIPDGDGAAHEGVCAAACERVVRRDDAGVFEPSVLGLEDAIEVNSDSRTSRLWLNFFFLLKNFPRSR